MGDHWATGRMEAFSDGVFAIAITLLILGSRTTVSPRRRLRIHAAPRTVTP